MMVRHLQHALAAGICVWAFGPGIPAARAGAPAAGAVKGVARDGSFIHESTSAHDVAVELRDRVGRLRAACQRVEDGVWACRGEMTFRAEAGEEVPAVAKRWAELLGGVTELVPFADAPSGLADACCSGIPELTGGAESGCNQRAQLGLLWHPSSRMVFFRYRVPASDGGDHVGARDVWLSPADLVKRLAARLRAAGRHGDAARAALAREALAWVKGAPPPTPYALYRTYSLLRCGTIDEMLRVDQPEREARAAFGRATRDYERRAYASAARGFLAAARLTRAIPEQCDKKYGRDNRLICYTNAALALRMANRCGSGRVQLLRAAEDEPDIAAEVRAIAANMGISGAKEPACP